MIISGRGVFQISKISKAFNNFDFNSTSGEKYTGLCNFLEIRPQKGFH